MHDEGLERTTDGRGPATALTMRGLKRLDAGSWLDPRFAGERVPTLAEALAVARGRGRLLLDIKSPDLERAIAAALREAGVGADAIRVFRNSDDAALAEFERLIPGVGILWGESPDPADAAAFDKLKAAGVVGFDLDVSSVTPAFISAAHARGFAVTAFTVLDPDAMRRGIALGLDGMETDYPAVLRALAAP